MKTEKEFIENNETSKAVGSEAAGEIGGIAGLLAQTSSILSLLVNQEEEALKVGLKAEDIATYKEAFNDFDHNKDGHISTQVFSSHSAKTFLAFTLL